MECVQFIQSQLLIFLLRIHVLMSLSFEPVMHVTFVVLCRSECLTEWDGKKLKDL